MTELILASVSPYRKELLSRFGLPFRAVAPPYDEEPLSSLDAAGLAAAHALGKARSVALQYPEALVIGSDQTAEVDGEILGKPGSMENALLQLLKMSGRKVAFHTGLALIQGERETVDCVRFEVKLRALTPEETGGYLMREKPFGCAGSFMIEGLGIALMESMEGADYTSLIGLPLIALSLRLREFGVNVLTDSRISRSSCR